MKIDYLTITLLPGTSGLTLEQTVDKALNCLFLDGLRSQFEVVGSNINYSIIMNCCNISLKLPTEKRFKKQGICIEFTGSGLDYYQTYLAQKHNTDLRTVCRRFRLLYKFGFKSKCTRLDIAFDDKCFGEDRPLLDLDVIEETLKDRAFISKFRRSEPSDESCELVSMFKVDPKKIDDNLPFRAVESMNISSGVIGKTIYLGKRKSNAFVRFYDKRAEQEVKGEELSEGLTHWVRFEIEFKRKNAAAIFNAFCDCKDDKHFIEFCAKAAFDLIRFVDKDHTRNYNCTVCAWWIVFLGAMADKGITINKLSSNQYIKSVRYINKTLAALLYSIVKCNPDALLSSIERGFSMPSKTKDRLLKDYEAYQGLSPGEQRSEIEKVYADMSGEEYWRLFTGDESDKVFAQRMFREHLEVFNNSIGAAPDEDK